MDRDKEHARVELLWIRRSFLAGCFGCLGVGSAITLMVLVVTVVFRTQFVAMIKTIVVQLTPLVSTQTPGQAEPTPAIEIWLAHDNSPDAVHVTQVTLPVQQPLILFARCTKAVVVQFTVRVVTPDGQIVAFSSGQVAPATPTAGTFSTDPTGKAISLGTWLSPPTKPGVYRIDAMVGETIVGSTVLTVLGAQ